VRSRPCARTTSDCSSKRWWAPQDSEESFDFTVCKPAWLAEQVETRGPLLGRHHLVVTAFDYDALEQFVRAFCAGCTGATWYEVGRKVGRLGRWEFEDYREPGQEAAS